MQYCAKIASYSTIQSVIIRYVQIILCTLEILCAKICAKIAALMCSLKLNLLRNQQMCGQLNSVNLRGGVLKSAQLINKTNNHWHHHYFTTGFTMTRNMFNTSVMMSGKFG